jgi:addiction module HigA family antidote
VIKSFADKRNESVYLWQFDRRLPDETQRAAPCKLRMVNNAKTIHNLRSPPGNRLEDLKGDREGQCSIRGNDPWCVCFEWREDNACKVEITDDHHEVAAMPHKKPAPVHPGEVLEDEFLKPLGLSQHRLALDTGVDPRRINEIVLRKRSVTANTALRLGRYSQTSPEFWLGLQAQYDPDVEEDQVGKRLEREVRIYGEAP